MKALSLIIPVYNGEKTIKKTVVAYFDHFSKEFEQLEIIVVCNACTDKTAEKCRELKREIPVKIVIAPKRGKGNALTKGFRNAQYNIIGFLDADNPFELERVSKMVSFLKNHDIVIATKFKRGQLKNQTSLIRRFFSLGNAVVARTIFGLNLPDTQAGAKFMKKNVWENIDGNFTCTGFEFDIELLYKIQKKGYKIKEYYLPPKSSDFSTVKMRILPGILYRLIKMRILN